MSLLPTSCGAGAGETFVLSVNVGAPTVDIALSDPSLTTSAISVRTPDCVDVASEIACQDFDSIGENPVHILEDVALPAGESFIVIEALIGDSATVSVTTLIGPIGLRKTSTSVIPERTGWSGKTPGTTFQGKLCVDVFCFSSLWSGVVAQYSTRIANAQTNTGATDADLASILHRLTTDLTPMLSLKDIVYASSSTPR